MSEQRPEGREPGIPAPERARPGHVSALQDRPTAAELLEAVREFLEGDVMPAVEGRVAFHARVAVNALGIVERELVRGGALDAAEQDRLAALLGHGDSVAELTRELAARIRDGSLDERRAEVLAAVRESVRAKLEVANPRYHATS